MAFLFNSLPLLKRCIMDHPFLNLMGEGGSFSHRQREQMGNLQSSCLLGMSVGLKRSGWGLFPYLLVWESSLVKA